MLPGYVCLYLHFVFLSFKHALSRLCVSDSDRKIPMLRIFLSQEV